MHPKTTPVQSFRAFTAWLLGSDEVGCGTVCCFACSPIAATGALLLPLHTTCWMATAPDPELASMFCATDLSALGSS